MSNYTVVMRDERSGSEWLFLENRDVGPRDQSLMLRLMASAGMMTGKISGPAIIATDGRRMTVLPNGDVVMTATAEGANGTWDGRLAAWLTDGGSYVDCVAHDHRLRLVLPRTP